MATRHTKQSHRLQHGRHVMAPPPPNPRAALQARVERRAEEQAQEQRRVAQEAQEAAQGANNKHAQQCRDIAMMRAGSFGLDGVSTAKLANAVESKRQAHVLAGRPLNAFDVYSIVTNKLAAMGHGLPVPDNANPLDGARVLPPPKGEGHLPPPGIAHHDAERAEQARRAAERARRLEEQNRRDREAYREALARHGLLDPVNGYPSGSGTSGLGV